MTHPPSMPAATIVVPGQRLLAVQAVLTAIGLLAVGGAMDWGMAGLFWVAALVLILLAWSWWPSVRLTVDHGTLHWQRGRRQLSVPWQGELIIIPMAGFSGLLLRQPGDAGELPLATWRRAATCRQLAHQLQEQLGPLPLQAIDPIDLELAQRYGTTPEPPADKPHLDHHRHDNAPRNFDHHAP